MTLSRNIFGHIPTKNESRKENKKVKLSLRRLNKNNKKKTLCFSEGILFKICSMVMSTISSS